MATVHADIIANLEQRSVRQAAAELDKAFKDKNVEVGVDVKAAQIKAAAEKIKREFDDIRAQVVVDVDPSASSRIRGLRNDVDQLNSSSNNAKNGLRVLSLEIQNLGKESFRTTRGLAALAVPELVQFLFQTAQVAVTASQSIALLPAAATTAAAGIGTLKLATLGFSDAMKDIGDIEKFHEDLIKLAPNAQQAALAIQNLLPQFKALQQATQNEFFAGFGEKIQQLTSTYLPQVQNMTTGIAQAMNKGLTGVADTLMTPENQANISAIMSNITQAFQAAAPAAQLFAQAFLDITRVGSEFLPSLGGSITTVAREFANFISHARDSGQLKVWIQEGIDAVKTLGGAILDIGRFVYEVFGGAGQSELATWRSQITDTLNTIKPLLQAMELAFKAMNLSIGDNISKLGQMTQPLYIIRDIINSMRWFLDPNYRTAQSAEQKAVDKLNEARAAAGQPPVSVATAGSGPAQGPVGVNGPNAPGGLGGMFSGGIYGPTPGAGGPGSGGTGGGLGPGMGLPAGPGQGGIGSTLGVSPNGSMPRPGMLGGPPLPASAKPPKPSQGDIRDAIRAGLDPSLYRVDPFAPVPGQPNLGALPTGPTGDQTTQDFYEKQQAVIQQGHDLEEARKDRLALERDNEATAEQINDAKWKEYQAGVALEKAQADLFGKSTKTAEKTKQAMDQIGVALDPDFGLGKGLPGFADNLVRFLGNLAFAPEMGKLQAQEKFLESQTGMSGGYGLLGMRGAANLSQGLSPLLGNPLPGGYNPPTGGSTGVNNPLLSGGSTSVSQPGGGGTPYGLPAGTNTGGYGTGTSKTFPPWVMALAQQFGVTPSTYPGHQESDRNEPGYAPNPQHLNRGIDWTGTAENMTRFAQAMAANPLAEQVIFNGPNGPVEAVAGQQRPGYFAGDLAAHGNHVHTRFAQDPTGGLTGVAGYTGQPGNAGSYTSSGGLPIPLPVTIVGSGASGSGPIAGITGAGPGGMPNTPMGKSLWDAVAQAESSGNWANADTSGTGHFGGLQFSPATWRAYGGVGMPQDATREQQIAVANRTAFTGYNGTPPQGLGAWQAITDNKVPGVNVNTPPSAFGTYQPTNNGQPIATGPITPGGIGGPVSTGTPPAAWYNNSAAASTPTSPGAAAGPSVTDDLFGGGLPMAGQFGADVPGGGPGIGPTRIGGLAPIAPNPGGQGIGIMPGGTIDSAIQAAVSGAAAAAGSSGFAPGAGAAGPIAQAALATTMKLANRAIQFAGQAAGIGAQGLMETFLPTGASELANNSWLTRIAGSIGAAAPALPNLAGGALGQQQQQFQGADAFQNAQGPLTPGDVAGFQGASGFANAPNIAITQNNNQGLTSAQSAANDIAHSISNMNAAPMAGAGAPPR